MRRYKVTATTAADGTVVAYSPRFAGEIHSIHYTKADFTNGVDFAITAEATGENIWTQADVNASAVVYPRAPLHDQAGAAALHAASGTPLRSRIGVAGDRVRIAITQGGNAKSGAFHILVA